MTAEGCGLVNATTYVSCQNTSGLVALEQFSRVAFWVGVVGLCVILFFVLLVVLDYKFPKLFKTFKDAYYKRQEAKKWNSSRLKK